MNKLAQALNMVFACSFSSKSSVTNAGLQVQVSVKTWIWVLSTSYCLELVIKDFRPVLQYPSPLHQFMVSVNISTQKRIPFQLCQNCWAVPFFCMAELCCILIWLPYPRRRNVTTLMVGLKKRSHTQKSHPKVVNPRDIAGERKKKRKKKKKKKAPMSLESASWCQFDGVTSGVMVSTFAFLACNQC